MIQTLSSHNCVVSPTISADKEAIHQLVGSAKSWLDGNLAKAKAVLPAVAVAGAVVLTLGSVISHHNRGAGLARSGTASTVRVVVGRGDSLWRIAHEYGDPRVAMEDRIDSLARLNGLKSGATLVAGQRLLVPTTTPVVLNQGHLALASR